MTVHDVTGMVHDDGRRHIALSFLPATFTFHAYLSSIKHLPWYMNKIDMNQSICFYSEQFMMIIPYKNENNSIILLYVSYVYTNDIIMYYMYLMYLLLCVVILCVWRHLLYIVVLTPHSLLLLLLLPAASCCLALVTDVHRDRTVILVHQIHSFSIFCTAYSSSVHEIINRSSSIEPPENGVHGGAGQRAYGENGGMAALYAAAAAWHGVMVRSVIFCRFLRSGYIFLFVHLFWPAGCLSSLFDRTFSTLGTFSSSSTCSSLVDPFLPLTPFRRYSIVFIFSDRHSPGDVDHFSHSFIFFHSLFLSLSFSLSLSHAFSLRSTFALFLFERF